jgi:hypothetical protein
MTHLRSAATTVVAITGANSLVEGILARLLEEEGYEVRRLEAHPTGLVEGPLEGVDVVLLAPGLKDGVREGFLEAMKSTQETSAIPVLPLSSALKLSLLDELAVSAPWRTLFEELVGQIGDTLTSAAKSAKALVVESGTGEPPSPPAAPQADAP